MYKTMSFALILLVAPLVNAALVRTGSFLGASDSEQMRPELVAQTLANVQDEWKQQAIAFTLHTPASKEVPGSFASSCATVISAVVQGSGGNRNVAKEYMSTVCSQKELQGWHKLRCADLTAAIVDHAMTADNFANRESLKPMKLCSSFWHKFVDEEEKREAAEAKERAEREKKEAEERAVREKKEAEEEEAAKVKAEAEAKVEAERRAKEEARREHEEKEQKAKREADEAKARAAEAAARLAQKKAEAEAVQKAAQEKLEEAAKAEKEHLQLQAEHEKAEQQLLSATKATPTKHTETEKVQQATQPAAKAEVKETKPLEAKATKLAETPQVAGKAAETPVTKKAEPKVAVETMAAPKKADAKVNPTKPTK